MAAAMAGRDLRNRLLVALWVAVGLQVVGQLVDLRWHLTHPEFETASDQLQAHWLIWLGLLVTVPVAVLGARLVPSRWFGGYRLLLVAWVFLVVSEVWHFWEHLQLRDPPAPHVLLLVGKLAVVAGAISATVVSRRQARWRVDRSAPR